MRKYVKAYIGTKSAIAPYKNVQEAETRYFLARILDNPDSVLENVRRLEPANIPLIFILIKLPFHSTAGSIFLKLSHGYTINTKGPDTLVELVESASKEFHTATLPGEWLIDNIPWSELFNATLCGPCLMFPKCATYLNGGLEITSRRLAV
jgi:hypothetical protein